MTVSQEIESKILRYHYAEHWPIGTIAKQLFIHHSVVRRVLIGNGAKQLKVGAGQKPLLITPYLPFILEKLEAYPKLAASRLYGMVKDRGYDGGEDHFRSMIARYRPQFMGSREAYLRLRTLPGEQAQVDWGSFGWIVMGKAKRPLMAFVMVLSYSRKLFVRFYSNAQMANFLRGHVAGFKLFGGIPRVILYDNLKSAVLEREGDAIRFNPELLSFAGYYRFEPRPVAPARGNEKGRVERSIRYIRDNFFAGREYQSLEDLNKQAEHWCESIADERRCPEDRERLIREVFLEEQSKLLALPNDDYPTDERILVKIGKTPYARYDLNDYSVPHKLVRRSVTVLGREQEVVVLDGEAVVARHPRCYSKGEQIEEAAHIEALAKSKSAAREHRGTDRLMSAVPIAKAFLVEAAAKSYPLQALTRHLTEFLDSYGATLLNTAMEEALKRGVPHLNAVRIALDKLLEAREKDAGLCLHLDKKASAHQVRPHDLATYGAKETKETKEKKGEE